MAGPNGGNAGWSGFHQDRCRHRHRIRQRSASWPTPSIELPFPWDRHHLRLLPSPSTRSTRRADPAHPKWENIKVDRQPAYTRMSELLRFRHAQEQPRIPDVRPRPPGGDRHLSAIARPDQQPGTINALINVAQRPVFKGEIVTKMAQGGHLRRREGRGTNAGANRAATASAGRRARARTTRRRFPSAARRSSCPASITSRRAARISTGALEAIQRVYFNIGSCSEQCWVNHFADMRQVDPSSAVSARRRSTSPSAGATVRIPGGRGPLQNILDFFARPNPTRPILQSARANQRKAKNPAAVYLPADLARSREGIPGRALSAAARSSSPITARAAIRVS